MDPEALRQVVKLCRLRVEHHYRTKLSLCIDALDDVSLWARPNEASNSIGSILLHTGEHLDRVSRTQRGEEAPSTGLEKHFPAERTSKALLLQQMQAAFAAFHDALTAIEAAPETDRIGLDRLLHVVEHLSYHVGQVVLLTTLQTRAPFDFVALGINEKQLKALAQEK